MGTNISPIQAHRRRHLRKKSRLFELSSWMVKSWCILAHLRPEPESNPQGSRSRQWGGAYERVLRRLSAEGACPIVEDDAANRAGLGLSDGACRGRSDIRAGAVPRQCIRIPKVS